MKKRTMFALAAGSAFIASTISVNTGCSVDQREMGAAFNSDYSQGYSDGHFRGKEQANIDARTNTEMWKALSGEPFNSFYAPFMGKHEISTQGNKPREEPSIFHTPFENPMERIIKRYIQEEILQ